MYAILEDTIIQKTAEKALWTPISSIGDEYKQDWMVRSISTLSGLESTLDARYEFGKTLVNWG